MDILIKRLEARTAAIPRVHYIFKRPEIRKAIQNWKDKLILLMDAGFVFSSTDVMSANQIECDKDLNFFFGDSAVLSWGKEVEEKAKPVKFFWASANSSFKASTSFDIGL